MMLNKILLNQVKKLIKEHIGLGDNKWEISKIIGIYLKKVKNPQLGVVAPLTPVHYPLPVSLSIYL